MSKKLVKTLLVTLLLLFLAPNQVFANETPQEHAKKLIVQTAQRLGVDPYLALGIAKIESNFNVAAKSPGGAIGLFQLTQRTAKILGVNPYIVSENIEGGIKYYKMMYNKYGNVDLALAAYNAGPGNVAKYKGVPPFKITQNFIKNIKKERENFMADEQLQSMVSDTI